MDGGLQVVDGPRPCNSKDRDLFVTTTTVTVGNGEKATFWYSAWLQGMRPKDIAPKIYGIAKKKKCTVKVALENGFWIGQLNIQQGISVEQISQFYKLCEMIDDVQLNQEAPDTILWKFGKDGSSSASSAYKMQFLGLVSSPMP
jgi:hypothetical protein